MQALGYLTVGCNCTDGESGGQAEERPKNWEVLLLSALSIWYLCLEPHTVLLSPRSCKL